jgi:7,8-dihydroneopterin aldolase/epimerase/oxygenase
MSSPAERVTVLPAALHGRTMKVFVRDLILPCRIGVYSHEQLGEQRVRINLELTCIEHPAINDEHQNVVCYAEVVENIRRLLREGHINLVETLAERIAAQCLEDHRTLGAKVRVEKLDIMPEASAVGVEIERHRVNR